MTNSQNGWPINPTAMTTITPGKALIRVRAGDVATVGEYFCQRFNDEVETLIPGQCGGYNPRKIGNTNVWSDHASATAWDLNWLKHQQGDPAEDSFTPHQILVIRHILNQCEGFIHWGADYPNPDPMHFSIHGTPAQLHVFAIKLLTPPTSEDDMTEAQLWDWIEDLMGQIANAALPDGDPAKNTTTQAGRNGLVYLQRIFRNLSGSTANE